MPEALETWPVDLMQPVLPRHLASSSASTASSWPACTQSIRAMTDFLRRLSLIDEHGERRVRMAHLSVVGSHKVNGVSALHSSCWEDHLRRLRRLWPERFTNMTNGVTPRRWLAQANPGLAKLIDRPHRPGWRRTSTELAGCAHADEPGFRMRSARSSAANKQRLAALMRRHDWASWSTRQPVRRAGQAHPRIQAPAAQRAARGGALPGHPGRAPGRLGAAHGDLRRQGGVGATTWPSHHPPDPRRGQVINNDPRVGDRLKVVFVPNYGVSLAEVIMPGGRPVRADLHRRHRGLGHRQHEARAQRRADHRHRRRRQHRDPPAGR
jgi:starch phosphorylase